MPKPVRIPATISLRDLKPHQALPRTAPSAAIVLLAISAAILAALAITIIHQNDLMYRLQN